MNNFVFIYYDKSSKWHSGYGLESKSSQDMVADFENILKRTFINSVCSCFLLCRLNGFLIHYTSSDVIFTHRVNKQNFSHYYLLVM